MSRKNRDSASAGMIGWESPGLLQPEGRAPGFSLAALVLLLTTLCGWSQGTVTVTSNPLNGATGVSGSAVVVFTFSAAMNPMSSSAFFQSGTSSFYPVTTSWSAGNTVLTCTPTSPFPGNTTINWTVAGLDASGMNFANSTGSFSTGTGGGGGGGSGTNATTSFIIGKFYLNQQTSSSGPVPTTLFGPYDLNATTGLESNRTASAITLTLPGSTIVTLTQNPVAHESYYFIDYSNSTAAKFEAAYPQGNYTFNVTGTPANLQAVVALPANMAQPNAPDISNFDAAQSVNAALAFTAKWNPFTNGTTADAITFSVSDGNGNTLFATPGPGTNGALSGTALSATIPPGKLAADSTNTAQVIFYRYVATSNANYVTLAYRATGTQFHIVTTGGVSSTPPVVSKPIWEANGFGFDVGTTANQALKVLFSTNCALPLAQWKTILTTNSPGSSVHLNISAQAGATGFIRLANGP